MTAVPDHERRIAAALCGAAAAQTRLDFDGGANPVQDMLAVAESIAERGGLDVDDLRQRQLSAATGTALLLRVIPFGLATPLDRPRLRRDSYRCAAAAGADEGTALVCVAAALVAADLMRFDPVTTATRVRQSLLEDAPMALLNRLTIVEPGLEITSARPDPRSQTTEAGADAGSTTAGATSADPGGPITEAGADPNPKPPEAGADAGNEITAAGADPGPETTASDTDPGAALQLALSVLEWTGCAGVAAALARLGDAGAGASGGAGVTTLAAALAGAVTGECDVPVDGEITDRAGRVAAALASLAGAAVP